ncbi:NHLP family bacteriocin export ABC transporter peptidase/permease/ATPase subunit [Microvirga tunisiensis]|uniref:NHLP family bacteriocin export ABC transporter peptidase/permease/ATPase subunit n=2 Tax=Pannonibacter tanglangensis TaxID=2750084 RepID=A0A7X5JB01_9HYPH|nr:MULTISPECIES: NHLP family bacteriocin export ABC transporter peptidase/permease/ATPase subunit [unclassified Pannonibacter]NBN65074.1 NHLP family bacteriocin export ABC transporter peptidase/permease/ATPase subunit [Pannonibacter sp. XCT-34]NBN79951.1 NHLP family bacteriocin export ABC transporter peptidase/permease/ATPase subunit [Pannonibacter sp. XCT-53]
MSKDKPAVARKRRRRMQTPTILQMEAVECGAASLAMILAHHGAWIPLEELRIACGVSRDGSKASNVLKAARRYGLTAKGYRKEPEGLVDLPWPAILHWNFNHYVVFEGMTETHAFINDPASGPRVITREELSEAFTGVVLTFERTPEFRRTAKPSGLMAAFRARVTQSHKGLALIAILSLALVIPGVVLPVYAKLFVDGVLMMQQQHWVTPLFLALAATALIRAVLTHLRASLILRLQTKLTITGASAFIWRVLHLPMAFFSQRSPGEVAERIEASGRVAEVISADMANALLNWGTLIFFALVLIGYDPLLGLMTVALGLPNLLLLRFVQKRLRQDSIRFAVEQGKLGGATVGIIYNIETIKASGLETSSFGRWAGVHARMLNTSQDVGQKSMITSLGPTLLSGLIDAAILGVGALRVMQGGLTIGDLVAFQLLAASFTAPLVSLVQLSPKLAAIRADLNRVDDAMRNPPDPLTQPPAPELARGPTLLNGALELDTIRYGYNPLDEPLFDGISLRARPGERIALVGRSGCGKSSLGRIICGLVAPWSGEVRIDGIPLSDLDQYRRAANIAYVDQEIFLFEGTVRENLTLWNPDVPDDAITRALEDAAILDDIVARPGELDARVEEGGRNFSGGQRQRLEIARALVGDPAVLVLDEATAALDPQTEKIIDENLRRRGCTAIIIAHRLSTVRDCSEIIVMDQGRIVERGDHDSLMAAGGDYADLIRSGGH